MFVFDPFFTRLCQFPVEAWSEEDKGLAHVHDDAGGKLAENLVLYEQTAMPNTPAVNPAVSPRNCLSRSRNITW